MGNDEQLGWIAQRRIGRGSTDYMRAPLEQFLMEAGEEQLRQIPVGVQSVRHAPVRWQQGSGVFIAFRFEDQTVWRFYPRSSEGWGEPVTDEPTLFQAIACSKAEPRIVLADPPLGPGGVVDWDLLVQAAREVAGELTSYRATADIARGASARSSRMPADLRQVALSAAVESDRVVLLLDRLEQVRVEDYDTRAGFRLSRSGSGRQRRPSAWVSEGTSWRTSSSAGSTCSARLRNQLARRSRSGPSS